MLVITLCRLAAGSGDVHAGSLLRLLMCALIGASLLMRLGQAAAYTRSIGKLAPRSELPLLASYMPQALIGFSITGLLSQLPHLRNQYAWKVCHLESWGQHPEKGWGA